MSDLDVDAGNAAREPLWDVVRALALARVVAWHTTSWVPLGWVAAMPAMFAVAGVLLDRSVTRHGWVATVRSRLPRLLVPFWLYGVVAVGTMVAAGWRPDVGALVGWVVPVVDPGGFDELPSLWIPLWYLRAYLWFLLGAGLLARLARFGWLLPAGFLVASLTQGWLWPQAPLAVGDLFAYGVFVGAGYVVARRGLPAQRSALLAGAVAAVVAVGLVAGGRAPVVAGATWTTTVLAGVATLAAVVAAAAPLRRLGGGRPGAVVDWVGRRALSIYLWHGFGLLAAERLVSPDLPVPLSLLLALGVSFGVTLALAAVVGPVEDLAAGRRPSWPSLRSAVPVAAGVGVAFLAVVVVPPASTPTVPLSGRGVLEAASAVEADLAEGGAPVEVGSGVPLVGDGRREVTDAIGVVLTERWQTWSDELGRLGVREANVVVASGDDPPLTLHFDTAEGIAEGPPTSLAWFSMTKGLTTGWLARLVEDGVVALNDPVSRFIADVPRGDEISLGHLARHQSGIPPEADTGFFDGMDVGADLRRWMAAGTLAFDPGTGFSYSRTGYTLLGWALERASGSTFRDTVASLGSEAGVALSLDEDVTPLEGPNRHPGEGSYQGATWASGALQSTTTDVVRYLHWQYRRGLRPESVALIGTASARPELAYQGLGVSLACPCARDGDDVVGTRFGLVSATGWWFHDPSAGVTMLFAPVAWLGDTTYPQSLFGQDLMDDLRATVVR